MKFGIKFIPVGVTLALAQYNWHNYCNKYSMKIFQRVAEYLKHNTRRRAAIKFGIKRIYGWR